jgi:hypothetical protein
MELVLKRHPTCHNCVHLVMKKDNYICKGHWDNEQIHPENAGHLKRKLTENLSLYVMNCEWYSPTREAGTEKEEVMELVGEMEKLRERIEQLEQVKSKREHNKPKGKKA